MANLFYLGGRDPNKQHQEEEDKEDRNLYLYRNDEIYHSNNKGFEIWPQAAQYYHHQHQQNMNNNISFGAGPSRAGFNFSFSDDHHHDQSSSRSLGFTVTKHGGGMNCQDCGNTAKKDCPHMRCRTCCKSRGFQCQTHVKSTWVPAAKRRERLLQNRGQEHEEQFRGEKPKRLRDRDHQGLSHTTSGLQLGEFPPELNSPAVFRCVKVSAMHDENEEDYAYQTAVNIAGHVFKGILYDQGPDHTHYTSTGAESSHSQQLNLIASASTTVETTTTVVTSSHPVGTTSMLDPNLFPAPLNAFLAGTPFFPPSRS